MILDVERHRYFGDKHWNEPIKWNRIAEKSDSVEFVFCASMSDWAEGRPEQEEHLERLWKLQANTPWLRWLMLTKRPQLINKLRPRFGSRDIEASDKRVWHGTTAETQKWMDIRWRHLKEVYSPVYWLSIEPLFERVVLPDSFLDLGRRAWVIVGGESGPHARPMHPQWAISLRDQCVEAGMSFHFKQWGEYSPWEMNMKPMLDPGRRYVWPDGKTLKYGDDNSGLDFRGSSTMQRIGNRDNVPDALDGIEWRGSPDA